jgi:uncharacterized ferritin-like protein (DUF455 family)
MTDSSPAGRQLDGPPQGTVERWCFDLVETAELAGKLAPAGPSDVWEIDPPARRLARPGRPPELRVVARAPKFPKPAALRRPEARAALLHRMAHHELQAAELFAWGLLAFPETPRAFRRGLVQLCSDELRHLAAYTGQLERLGYAFGAFGVRDWFWERVATCADAASFVALLGLGLEGANLEHAPRLAAWLRNAGDEEAADALEQVERDEVSHVAFAVHWFERFTGAPLDYDRWCEALPRPLTPSLLRGAELNFEARRRAGQDDAFLARLAAAPPASGKSAR